MELAIDKAPNLTMADKKCVESYSDLMELTDRLVKEAIVFVLVIGVSWCIKVFCHVSLPESHVWYGIFFLALSVLFLLLAGRLFRLERRQEYLLEHLLESHPLYDGIRKLHKRYYCLRYMSTQQAALLLGMVIGQIIIICFK